MKLEPIGVIHSPYKNIEDAPRQGKTEDTSRIEIFETYKEGLKDVKAWKHLIILYWLGKAKRDTLLTLSPFDSKIHGVFAVRSPHRPNPIGLAVVDLIDIKDNILEVSGMDAVDGTEVIDIKPYYAKIDGR
ncbi:tRNA-Thr(GGU) m(6)t(6)A37 methyltransferase TsaA [Candidatus Altiarchaeales archaeon WOR_SM1_SCG]|nr:tRNA-Thr(GGU) m(6)t(6)A37 methyltransferase TsaA [Candidatus Altiarchaeales archaeon WOR_SM1_SCG]ODS37558.1 MAG: tRNA-Thr(GGU) m(6)t(6)A37 methyltransferase TsaA [Candidatus Altiarchaeales archaeon WOR_SM1_79]